MSQTNLAVLTGDRINEVFVFFFARKCMVVLPGGQKSGRNNEKVTRITKVVVTLCCAKSRRCESPPLTPNFLRKRQKFPFQNRDISSGYRYPPFKQLGNGCVVAI